MDENKPKRLLKHKNLVNGGDLKYRHIAQHILKNARNFSLLYLNKKNYAGS